MLRDLQLMFRGTLGRPQIGDEPLSPPLRLSLNGFKLLSYWPMHGAVNLSSSSGHLADMGAAIASEWWHVPCVLRQELKIMSLNGCTDRRPIVINGRLFCYVT